MNDIELIMVFTDCDDFETAKEYIGGNTGYRCILFDNVYYAKLDNPGNDMVIHFISDEFGKSMKKPYKAVLFLGNDVIERYSIGLSSEDETNKIYSADWIRQMFH